MGARSCYHPRKTLSSRPAARLVMGRSLPTNDTCLQPSFILLIQTHHHKPRDVGGTGSKAQSCLAVCTRCILRWLRTDPALHAVGGLKQGDRCWRWQESCGSMMAAQYSTPILPARAAFVPACMHHGAESGSGSPQQVSLN